MPNCPLRGGGEIADATAFFQAGAHEFQISVFEFGWMNPWWAMRRRLDGMPEPLFPNARQARSQDLDRLYCPTGAIWIATSAGLRAHRSFYGPGHVILPMPWESALDIDDFDDLRFAEAVATMRAQRSGLARLGEMGWRKTE